MEKLNVLHIAKWYPNKFDVQNGVFVQKHVSAIALETVSTVLFFKEDNQLDEPYEIEDSKLNGVRQIIVYHPLNTSAKNVLLKYKVFKQILQKLEVKQDVFHFHILSADQLLFAKYAKNKGIPCFITEHWSGYIDDRFNRMSKINKILYKCIAKQSSYIFPVSNFLKAGMKGSGLEGNYHVVPNVVETYTGIETKKDSNFTFIMVSDLDDQNKNISEVMTAFNELNQNNLRLKIVGGGPDLVQLKMLSKELNNPNVTLIGRLNNSDALREMNSSHCLIVNSTIETFSIVGIEARSMGLQVIATKCGGPQEFLDSQSLLIETGSQTELMEAMKKVIHMDSIEPMDISNFSPKNIVEIIHGYYRKAIVSN